MPLSNNPAGAWARVALTKRVLGKVAGPLAEAGVRALAVKGVVTSDWLYADPSERPLTDLDLRVPPAAIATVARVASKQGWGTLRRLRTYNSIILYVDGIGVDVESDIGPPGVSALGVEALLARATEHELGYWIPEAHDHALLLTLNVFKDKMWAAASWALEDAARVLRIAGFNLPTYVSRVREARVTGPAWLVADWMAAHRGHAEWKAIRDHLGGDRPSRAVYTRAMRALISPSDADSFALRALSRLGSDDPWSWPRAALLAAAFEAELRLFYRGRRSG